MLCGWCAGRNPPFVFDGIQLYGLPASPAEITDAYSPFHPAGQPFHRIQPHPQRQTVASQSSHSWTYRFCSGTKALAPRPYRRYSSAWWAEFPQATMPEAVRQLTNPQKHYLLVVEIKIVILLTTNKPIQQCLYFPTCVLGSWRSKLRSNRSPQTNVQLLTSRLGVKGGVSFYLLAMITEHRSK